MFAHGFFYKDVNFASYAFRLEGNKPVGSFLRDAFLSYGRSSPISFRLWDRATASIYLSGPVSKM
jgi:hypothetical protein